MLLDKTWGRIFALITALALGCTSALAQDGPPAEWRYSVRPGDSLMSIARLYLKDADQWPRVARHNQLQSPDVLLTGQILRIPVAWLRQEPGTASLVSSTGLVSVQVSGNEPFRPAQVGMPLASGARVRTAAQSSGVLKFADGSLLTMQPLSLLSLDLISVYAGGSMVDTSVRLLDGRLQVQANPFHRAGQRFEVTTPSAVAAVRGTEFWLQANDQRTLQQTLEGKVRVSAHEAMVDVPKGFGNVVALGEPPSAAIALEPAPDIRDWPAVVTRLPIVFTLPAKAPAERWYAQVSGGSSELELVRELSVNSPRIDWVSLPDGAYTLKVQSIADSGLPGLPALHKFVVAVPREKVGAALALKPSTFRHGPLEVQLPPLQKGQGYVVELAEDAQGRRVLWQSLSDQNILKIPEPDNASGQTLHFLAWRYTQPSE
jgi:hypothetical protein